MLAEPLTGDPLYAVIDRPEGKVARPDVDLDKSDLPLRTAFPILMTNALGWFAGTRASCARRSPTGAVAEVELPPETDPRARRLLRAARRRGARPLPAGGAQGDASARSTSAASGRSSGGPRAEGRAGEAAAAETLLELACNLANRRESDLRPPTGSTPRAADRWPAASAAGRSGTT